MHTCEPNRVSNLFANRTILITGGTGFVGKVLIEKLLRTCSTLKKIYLIVRTKKGKNPEERLKEMFSGELFRLVKQQHGVRIFDKVEGISGDVVEKGLGLSSRDRRKLIEEAEIVYHSAASVKFDEGLKEAVRLNVKGTKMVLDLAEECKKLMVLCHISTAYCHEEEEILEDNKLYLPPADPRRVLQLCEWMDEENLNLVAHHVRGTSANNYTFTKALAESLVEEKMQDLPLIIQRITAVVPTWKEPIPGWTDNINGPVGLLIGAGKGVIRTMCVKKDIILDCLPADIVVNMMINSTYDYVTYRTRRVFNLTISKEVELTPNELIETGKEIVHTKIPFSRVLWYPNGSIKSSRLLHYVEFFLFQLLPAILIDAILIICGVKPFLLKVQKRIWKGYQTFDYYANREWDFRNDNIRIVRRYLNSTEKSIFCIDSEGFDFREYLTNCIIGARRYILKEPDDDIPAAAKRMKMLWFLDMLSKIFLASLITYYIYGYVYLQV